LGDALRYTRQNPEQQGTQNLNYKYHMAQLKGAMEDVGLPRAVVGK